MTSVKPVPKVPPQSKIQPRTTAASRARAARATAQYGSPKNVKKNINNKQPLCKENSFQKPVTNNSRPCSTKSEAESRVTTAEINMPVSDVIQKCDETIRESTLLIDAKDNVIDLDEPIGLDQYVVKYCDLPQSSSPNCSRSSQDIQQVIREKMKEFQGLKKELDIKQQFLVNFYNGIKELQEEIGDDSDPMLEVLCEDLKIVDVKDWAQVEMNEIFRELQFCTGAGENFPLQGDTDENFSKNVIQILNDVHGKYNEICFDVIAKRQKCIDFIKDFIERDPNVREEEDDIEKHLQIFLNEGNALIDTMKEISKQTNLSLNHVFNMFKQVLQERTILMERGQEMLRKISLLESSHIFSNSSQALQDLSTKLEQQKLVNAKLLEHLQEAEAECKSSRLRSSKLETQLKEVTDSLAESVATLKTLEAQNRKRDSACDGHVRKLRDTLAANEAVVIQLKEQKDELESKVRELTEEKQKSSLTLKSRVSDLKAIVNELKGRCEELQNQLNSESDSKKELERRLSEANEALKEYSAKFECVIKKGQLESKQQTIRELELQSQLEVLNSRLISYEQQINSCQIEKKNFLDTIVKTLESNDEAAAQQRLTAELITKEETIDMLQTQLRELSKHTELNEHKLLKYEQLLQETCNAKSIDNSENGDNESSNIQDLQSEVVSLRMKLIEAGHTNDELSALLTSKQNELEAYERGAHNHKVREELIAMLQKKDVQQQRDIANLQMDLSERIALVDQVNQQISSKAEEIQDLFLKLEMKQQQIHKLEKFVAAMQEQQERGQTQRVKQEEKIGSLEKQLHELTQAHTKKYILF